MEIQLVKDALHAIFDALAGRSNIPAHDADVWHEKIDPGYTAPKDTPEQIAAAEAIVARQQQAAAYQASQAAPAPAAAEAAPQPGTVL